MRSDIIIPQQIPLDFLIQVHQLGKFCLNYIDERSTMAYRHLVIQPLLKETLVK